jgi:5-methylcytosine-specific restriction endonuclease McrA
MPVNYKDYPPNWKEIRREILRRAGDRCEGSPAYPDCRAENGEPHPVTGSRVVLTIAHLDHDTKHNDQANLRALCQRCHLTYDARHHAENAKRTRIAKRTRGMIQLWSEEV